MAKRVLQFVPDFSASGALAPDTQHPSAGKTQDSVPKVPLVQSARAQIAIENIAPVAPLASTAFRHPRATREVLLNGQAVAFEVKRRKRNTIGFSVGAEGLSVSAPQWVPLLEIDLSVQGKSGWILKKLQETRERRSRLDAARIVWKGGAVFAYLGEPVRVVLDSRQPHGALHAALAGADAAQSLHLSLSDDASATQIERAVQAWLMQQASPLFTRRLNHFAVQLNVQWHKLSLSSAATRWGSASASGAIRLNWRLLHFRLEVIDYVVVHELSHLRVMDHSARFWATVHSVIPDYAALRNQLKDEVVGCK
ncbi:M48 family metallopeptidase [Polaromonas sp. CG_9.5]|uniref:M48 family metallopeptidase n=1 Tax=Polaromonas sp. CG_9.5 TaxID=3071705 RepID=UPI002E1259DB